VLVQVGLVVEPVLLVLLRLEHELRDGPADDEKRIGLPDFSLYNIPK
jgi:hypothetical protein